MDAKQKIHQANLELWIQRFKDKSASGLTVKEWCEQNNRKSSIISTLLF